MSEKHTNRTENHNRSAVSSQFNQVSTRLTELQLDDQYRDQDPSLIQLMNSNGGMAPNEADVRYMPSEEDEDFGYDAGVLEDNLEKSKRSTKKMKKKRQIEKNSLLESQSEGSCCAGGGKGGKCEIF